MADTTVSIAPDGALSPSTFQAEVGDTVTFAAQADAVLCVAPASVFGAERYEIPAGERLALQVQAEAGKVDFTVHTGDLSALCRGGRDKGSSGRGSVGGGPD